MRYVDIPVDIYKARVIVVVAEDFSQLPDILTKEEVAHIEDMVIRDTKPQGVTINNGSRQIVWILKNRPGIVAHELFHAVEYIFDMIGLQHCDESSEAFAYLIEYLTEEYYKSS